MPRFVIAFLAALLLPTAAASAAPCPGSADPCPYSATSAIGSRAGGVLRFPQASAVGPDGAVYVADQYTHAIQVFAPDGRFERELGVNLTSVGAVAVAPDGVVYVADGSDRIDRYAADGRLLNSWGTSGNGVGEFHFGTGGGNDSGAGAGLAVGAGSLWVADTRNDRVQRFALDGSGASVVVPPGKVKRPQGLAVSGGRLLVADDLNHRIAVFGLQGDYVGAIGSGPGPSPRQLQNPYDVAVDPLGRVFVADNSNHRVVRFGAAPTYPYRARWGFYGSKPGGLQYPRGLSVDAQGRTYVADPGGNRIDVFDAGGTSLSSFGSSGRVLGQFIRPLGITADASGVRAVADSVNGRVQLLAPDGRVLAAFGAPAPGPTLLPNPVAVAFDASGKLYVVDQERSRVLVFDRGGTIIRTIGSQGSGPGKLLNPSGIAISSGGTIYVADTGNGRIVRYSTDGTHLGSIGRFNTIRGVAISPDGQTVYAADSARNRISVLSFSGADVAEIGYKQLKSPWGVAVDAAGNVWVADRGNDRVAAFGPDGTLLTAFGERGVAAGQFVEPAGISIDCNGLVSVAEADNNRVQQFQVAPPGACAALPAITPPPNPILATQPDPPAPELTVSATRTTGILGIRQFPLKVKSDTPVKLTVVVTLAPRGKSKPVVKLSFPSISLAAGKTVTVRPRLSVAGGRSLKKALKGKRGLTASLSVTGEAESSAPAVVTKKLSVTG